MSLTTKRAQPSKVTRSTTTLSVKHPVAEVASKELLDSGYSALRSVRCEFHEGVLTLRGRVPSYYLKQIAQTLIRRVDRVELIENRLDVSRPTSCDETANVLSRTSDT